MTEREIEIAAKLGKLITLMTEAERAYMLGFLDGLQVSKLQSEEKSDEKTNQNSEE